MRRDFVLKITIIVTLLIAIGVNIYGRNKKGASISSDNELQSLMPEGDFFKKKEEPFLYYEVYKKDELIGYSFNTKDMAQDERGYGGPIEIALALDTKANIVNLKVLNHNESQEYAKEIAGPRFLGQFKGKTSRDSFIIGEDIDGVTHATISARAVASILKTSVVKMESLIQGFEDKTPRKPSFNLDIDFYITVLIITFLLVAFYLKKSFIRYIGLILSIIYFGFIKAIFISISNLGNIFLLQLPDFKLNISWYIFIFSGLFLTFLLGKFYCSYMCPFGGIQVFLNKLFKFNIEITPQLTNRLRKIRYFLLWILTILVISLNNSNIVNYEPFSTVFLRRGNLIAWTISLIIIVLSLFHHRPFCNYFCSAGAFLDILSSWGRRIFRKR